VLQCEQAICQLARKNGAAVRELFKRLTVPDVMRVAQIQRLVSAVLEGEQQLHEEDIVTLFSARGADFDLVCEAAGIFLFCVNC